MEKFKIKPLLLHPIQNYLNNRMQLGEVLEQVLEFTGPADIVVSTFSTAEEFLTKLHRLKAEGKVKSAILYTDHKAAEKTAKIIPMVQRAYDEVHFVANHSKLMLIKGCRGQAVVLTSQNQTRGNRLESYTIFAGGGFLAEMEQTLKDLPQYQMQWKS